MWPLIQSYCCAPFLAPGINQANIFPLFMICQKSLFSCVLHLASTKASLLKSSFDGHFHKLCSGANQIAFYDFRTKFLKSKPKMATVGNHGSLSNFPWHYNLNILLALYKSSIPYLKQLLDSQDHLSMTSFSKTAFHSQDYWRARPHSGLLSYCFRTSF